MTAEERAKQVNAQMDEWINEQRALGNWPTKTPDVGQSKYAEIVAQAIQAAVDEEREACAHIAELCGVDADGHRCAAKIRARGGK